MFSFPFLTCFEGEGEGEGEGKEGEGEGEKKFSQEDVNGIVAEEKRKTQVAQRKQAQELEELRKSSTLTKEEKETLQTQIEDLKKQYMTAEERSSRAKQEADKKNENLITELTQERDDALSQHSKLVIDNAITYAATEQKAIFVEPIAAILNPKTKLKATLDTDGNPTGEMSPVVLFEDVDKNDKPIVLELTIPETVKRMRELDRYANLFSGDKSGGLGQTGSQGKDRKLDLRKIAEENPREYRRLRKEQPELFD